MYFRLVYFQKQSLGPGLACLLHTLGNDPKEQERSAGKGKVEKKTKPASVLDGLRFPHGTSWTVGIRMAEQVPQADPGQTGEMHSATDVRRFSVFPPPLAVPDRWDGRDHCVCAKGERQVRIWNSNSQVLTLAVKYCLSNKTARIPDY